MNFFDNLFTFDDSNSEINGLVDSLKAIYIYDYYKKTDKSVLVVLSSLYEANRVFQEISSFTDKVLLFPMDDFLTSEALAISPELKNTRLETLNALLNENQIVVTNLMGYLRYLPPKDIYSSKIIKINSTQEYSKERLVRELFDIGYTPKTLVDRTGTYASRGYVVDIFPISMKNPIRIEFWGDQIESIKEFNVDTQLTIKAINSLDIYPNTEFLVNDIDRVEYKNRLQKNIKEYIIPSNIFEFMNEPIIFYYDLLSVQENYKLLVEEIFNYNASLETDSDFKYMNDLINISPKKFKNFVGFDNINNNKINESYESMEISNFSGSLNSIYERLCTYLNVSKTVILCFSDRYKLNKFLYEFEGENIVFTNETEIFNNKINLIVHKMNSGFEYKQYVCISESELYNRKSENVKYKTNFTLGTKIRDVNKLNVGDYIVHYSHGIGRYLGIKSLNKNGFKKDYLELEYKDGDKLYIPVEKIELINKYSGNDGIVPKINKLGTSEWQKTKLKLKEKLQSIAADLLKLYAEREASKGIKFDIDTKDQIEFEKDFPYTETADQLRVTEEIKHDMESIRPMDRLLCGDVGYGKTEVAFRAAFKAIMSGYQVAMLCPTTILSNQHFQNALDRFASFAVNIRLLNRFTSSKEQKIILKEIQEGKVDLLIGTHRILSNDINFKQIGLLIVDEEQRFGVKHKEQIKKYKNNIDVLTLSATPIPRTLQMSMSGIRSLSLLETPPVDRYPIQTYVIAENDQIIKDAIYKELSRNGQIFILYNNVVSMEKKKAELEKLVPTVKIICAHGKMNKAELENIMLSFINKEYDILLCTTIIETGIDISNANTLLIMDADKFGLSQLYQIRGRVGRSNKIAYCYLMYNRHKVLSDIAIKRLKVIKDFTELGSGFSIAVRDLSIRGAGDILGSEQAGYVDSVGVELFLKMLNEEVDRQKGKPIISESEISETPLLDVTTSIDDTYVSDSSLKIEIHQMINGIDSMSSLEQIKEQIEDRFGKLSEELIIYMYQELFEKVARTLEISKVNQTKTFVEIILDQGITSNIDGEKIFMEAYSLNRMFRFSMKGKKLSIILDTVKLDKHYIYYLLPLCEIIKNSIKTNINE